MHGSIPDVAKIRVSIIGTDCYKIGRVASIVPSMQSIGLCSVYISKCFHSTPNLQHDGVGQAKPYNRVAVAGAQLVHGLMQSTMAGCIGISNLGEQTDLLGGLKEPFKTNGKVTHPGPSLKKPLKNLLGLKEHEIFLISWLWQADSPGHHLAI